MGRGGVWNGGISAPSEEARRDWLRCCFFLAELLPKPNFFRPLPFSMTAGLFLISVSVSCRLFASLLLAVRSLRALSSSVSSRRFLSDALAKSVARASSTRALSSLSLSASSLALCLSPCSSLDMADLCTSAAAARVLSAPFSSSLSSACLLQNCALLRSLLSRSSASLCFAIASALRFCAFAAASAALCVTVEFQSFDVHDSADWMACSATLTARAASAREASSSARSSVRAWCSSSTISWSKPCVRDDTSVPASPSSSLPLPSASSPLSSPGAAPPLLLPSPLKPAGLPWW
mmetsp:Transcript_37466/g.69286  ORF Transcript_37466/g.69286 Transcript_37466/m.69286 type:complete len:293 (+) Transcript_37466:1742-2620(+)